MTGMTTQFKLGLFTIAAVVALIAVAIGLGVRRAGSRTVRYHTYFDESVQGLDVGSPVKYRGVRIGDVSAISIAPDRRWVGVTLSIDRAAADRLGLARLDPALRAQLALQGITGVKFIDMDFVDPTRRPPPDLGFQPGDHYIPSRPSLFAGLEDRLGGVTRALPDLIDRTSSTLGKLAALLEEIRDQRLVARAGAVLDELGGASQAMRATLRDLQRSRLPARMASLIDRFDRTAAKLDTTLDRFAGADELIASAKRATDSFAEVGRRTRGSARELTRTLEDVGEAARALRAFLDELERDPDMLIKGRRR